MKRRYDSIPMWMVSCLVALLMTVPAWTAPAPEQESPSYRSGREALDRADWRSAERAFEEAVREDESRADAATYWLA